MKDKTKRFKSKFFCSFFSNITIVALLVMVYCAGFAFNNLSTTFWEKSDKAIYNGDIQKNNVSLMINVYWGTEYVQPILQILNKYDVKATFFVGGCWIAKNEEVFLKIVSYGHEIGNHAYFHKDHQKLDYDGNYNEIAVTHKLVKQLVGVEMTLFAPPSGSFDNTTLQVASDLNYRTIMWSKDTIDWRDKDESLVFSRATKNLKNGDLILMHPTQHTLNALEKIIKFIKDKNFNLVSVSDNIGT